MFDIEFYSDLRAKMSNHDMVYNEFVDFRVDSPLYKENFNVLQSNIIAYINNIEGLSVNELCKIVKVLPTNLSPIIKDMEQRGWIERYRKDDDKRFVYLRLSENGEQKMEEHRKNVTLHLASSLNLALTEEEQKDFDAIYERLIGYFKRLVEVNKKYDLSNPDGTITPPLRAEK